MTKKIKIKGKCNHLGSREKGKEIEIKARILVWLLLLLLGLRIVPLVPHHHVTVRA
jgi:hypothetical protein